MLGKEKEIILHFDVNKTVLISDAVQNLDKQKLLNRLIPEYAWGTQQKNSITGEVEWTLAYQGLSHKPPSDGLINYKEHTKLITKKKTAIDEPDEIKRENHNSQQRKLKYKLINKFLTDEGNGRELRSEFYKVLQQLEFPEKIVEKIKRLEGEEAKIISTIFKENSYELIPALFNTIIKLHEQKKIFKVVFRTFGTDLDTLIGEFNLFCEGRHPCYDGKDGNPFFQCTDYKIGKEQSGLIIRSQDEIKLIVGTLDRRLIASPEFKSENVQIYEGLEQIYKFIRNSRNTVLALQDHYLHWKENSFSCNHAKPLIIDERDQDVLQLFFDDNIDGTDESIVDTRSLNTGKPLSRKEALEKHLVIVDTFKAIADPNYFLSMIKERSAC